VSRLLTARLEKATLLALTLAACGGSVQPQAGSGKASTASTSNVASQPAQGQQSWDDLLTAAKKEQTVVVFGPPTPDLRTQLPPAFKQRFGVELQYTGQASGEVAPKLASERLAGLYTTDVIISGANSMYGPIAGNAVVKDGAMGMLAPLRPGLVLPEVLDRSKYRSGQLPFVDPPQQYMWSTTGTVNSIIALNTERVKPADIKSWNDLLKPDYTGKIVTYDPTIAGAATNQSSEIYLALGEDYLKKLYVDQKPFVVRDHQQAADLLSRGSDVISLSLEQQALDRAQKQGLPVAFHSNSRRYAGKHR